MGGGVKGTCLVIENLKASIPSEVEDECLNSC
jgi:hypothetical protein